MRCAVCKKDGDEVQLFEGIFNAEMVMVCEECAETEGIPLIRKPTKTQLDRSEKTYSVRERMERMSGMRKTTPLSDDQAVVQGNLAKLKELEPKQTHPDVHDNYYWQVNMGRRRKKITISQMAKEVGISVDVIESIEKGKVPADFEEVFPKLEKYLGVKLLKHHKPKVTMHRRNRDQEKEILASVKQKMDAPESVEEEPVETNDGEEQAILDSVRKKMEGGADVDVDFSKREKLGDITLNDLVDRKKRREAQKKKFAKRSKEEAMIGDDIDLDE